MEYDFNRLSEIIEVIMERSWRSPGSLMVGEDISDFSEVKVIFNKYGYNEETGQDDDLNVEEYCVFIHLNSGSKGFVFPEHEQTPIGLIHRPDEEVCVYVWFLKGLEQTEEEKESMENEGEWDIEDLENSSSKIDPDEVMEILEQFASNYSIG